MHLHQSHVPWLVLTPGTPTRSQGHLRLNGVRLSHKLQTKTSSSGKALRQQLFANQILHGCCRQAPVRLSVHRAGGSPSPALLPGMDHLSPHTNRSLGDRVDKSINQSSNDQSGSAATPSVGFLFTTLLSSLHHELRTACLGISWKAFGVRQPKPECDSQHNFFESDTVTGHFQFAYVMQSLD